MSGTLSRTCGGFRCLLLCVEPQEKLKNSFDVDDIASFYGWSAQFSEKEITNEPRDTCALLFTREDILIL